MSDMKDEGTPNRRRRLSRLGAASVVMAASGAGVLLFGLNPSSSGAVPVDAPTKAFVCKYVGTPGVDEHLQTGQNPIDVSFNAINEDPVVVGTFFADGQGRSFVLAFDIGQDTPPVTDCAATTESSSPPPTTEPPTTEPPTSVPPSGSISGTESSLPPSSSAAISAAASSSPGPVPAAASAGKHAPVSNTSVLLGGALMAAGAGGLAVAARPRKRGSH
jgi:hypothetical protein